MKLRTLLKFLQVIELIKYSAELWDSSAWKSTDATFRIFYEFRLPLSFEYPDFFQIFVNNRFWWLREAM